MKNELKKPITIVREEFVSSIVKLVNESGLPYFIMEPILKDLYIEVKSASKAQYEQDLKNYMDAQNKTNNQ